ncbi:pyridoxal phosphate-dependent transferase [Xylaria digitata]|nr:pyridoxal phosphate-dependent transferase [Xylaria digitata]
MAHHLNTHFAPAQAIDAEEITFAAGVTNLNEACALVTCNPDAGEAIMLGSRCTARSPSTCVCGLGKKHIRSIHQPLQYSDPVSVELEYVSVGDRNQFTPDCVAAFEAGYDAAIARGKNIRALIICNPHNPLGHCYPREMLIGLLQLCARKRIHLISDKVYALSTYSRNDREPEVFTSIRSINFAGVIDPKQVHVLYGMSKNREFTDAVRAICCFASPSQFSMHIAASLLEDQDCIRSFLDKSRVRLLQNRLLAEPLLSEAGIAFHDAGNAGLFLWIDLGPFLPVAETNGDGWAA